jgi:hypothetical protein
MQKQPICGEEVDTMHVVLKYSENKLWRNLYIKKGASDFGNEILVMNISYNKHKRLIRIIKGSLFITYNKINKIDELQA